MRVAASIAVVVLASCAPGVASVDRAVTQPALAYTVTLDAPLAHMRVRVCPLGPRLPDALVPIHDAAIEHIVSVALVEDDAVVRTITPSRRLDLTNAPPHACVRYDVDLSTCTSPHGPASCARSGRDVFAPTSTWLLAPEPRLLAAHYTLRFLLPEGAFATPFADQHTPRGEPELIDERAFAFVTYVAFTHAAPRTIDVPGAGCIDVVALDGTLESTFEERAHWLRVAASASARVTGHLPADRLTAIVIPTIDVPSMPVLFGVAGRGMRPTVTLLVGAHASEAALLPDWTAVHELAHFLVADVDDEDAWLSEGLATYYEEVLRAREGLLGEVDAWTALEQGFARGREGCNGTTLREASRTMHESRRYACVYWSGAALALLADVAYRRAGGSLDEAILRAWPHRSEHTSGAELVAWLDGAPSGPFATVAAAALESPTFPDVTDAYAWLGVDVAAGVVTLRADRRGAAARTALMNGVAPLASNPSGCTGHGVVQEDGERFRPRDPTR